MKKLLSILLVCILALSVFAACGKKDEIKTNEEPAANFQEDVKNEPEVSNNEEKTEEPKKEEVSYTPVKPSENTEVVTAKTAPEVYIISSGGTDNAHLCYHLESCKLLNGTENQKVTWEMIEMIQFRQCPECNPPRYEDYVE